jgi:chromosome segregation ATPase
VLVEELNAKDAELERLSDELICLGDDRSKALLDNKELLRKTEVELDYLKKAFGVSGLELKALEDAQRVGQLERAAGTAELGRAQAGLEASVAQLRGQAAQLQAKLEGEQHRRVTEVGAVEERLTELSVAKAANDR